MTSQKPDPGHEGRDAGSGAASLKAGLGAWASAVSADENAQAAIALAEAINRAREERAARENRVADARVAAVGRLETLRAMLAPVYAAIPRDVELFDLGMVGHDPPRLFVDIIAFVEPTEDRRALRLVQETRNGRVVLGEAADERRMTELVTGYIAERLVERERALAARHAGSRPAPLPEATPTAILGPTIPTGSEAAPAGGAAGVPPSGASPPQEQAPAAVASSSTRTATPAARPVPPPARQRASGGWLWPLLALLVGVGLGALALYFYALSLQKI